MKARGTKINYSRGHNRSDRTGPDQTGPDQARQDQARPDQTRPDQTSRMNSLVAKKLKMTDKF